jgi:hypothetical protein
MRTQIAFPIFSVWAATVVGQQLSVVAPSEISAQQKLVEQAWREWETSDADLERSLFSAPVQRVLAQIERGRRHVIAYHEQRAKFLEAITASLRRELALLQRDDQELAVLEQEPRKVDILLKSQASLEGRLRSAGRDPVERLAIEQQAALIKQLAANISAQQALYSAFKENQGQNRKIRQALVESYSALIKLLGEQIRLNEDKRELWLQYYDSLREFVEARRPATAGSKGSTTARPRK